MHSSDRWHAEVARPNGTLPISLLLCEQCIPCDGPLCFSYVREYVYITQNTQQAS
jgi:hypothetical protein